MRRRRAAAAGRWRRKISGRPAKTSPRQRRRAAREAAVSLSSHPPLDLTGAAHTLGRGAACSLVLSRCSSRRRTRGCSARRRRHAGRRGHLDQQRLAQRPEGRQGQLAAAAPRRRALAREAGRDEAAGSFLFTCPQRPRRPPPRRRRPRRGHRGATRRCRRWRATTTTAAAAARSRPPSRGSGGTCGGGGRDRRRRRRREALYVRDLPDIVPAGGGAAVLTRSAAATPSGPDAPLRLPRVPPARPVRQPQPRPQVARRRLPREAPGGARRRRARGSTRSTRWATSRAASASARGDGGDDGDLDDDDDGSGSELGSGEESESDDGVALLQACSKSSRRVARCRQASAVAAPWAPPPSPPKR